MPSIPMSDENYRKLQRLGRAFEDTPDDVIGRLVDQALALDGNWSAGENVEKRAAGLALSSRAGSVADGSVLKATYKGREFEAHVRDGAVWWNGKRYSTLSAAAVAVIQSTGSGRATENGWRFWRVSPAARPHA